MVGGSRPGAPTTCRCRALPPGPVAAQDVVRWPPWAWNGRPASAQIVSQRMTIAVGEQAPDFTAEGTDGTSEGRRPYSLAEFRGQPVVLVFYPADHSPVCTAQLTSYSHDIGQFADLGAQVLALSPQTVEEHEAFAEANGGFAFPLLADPAKAVGRELRHPGSAGVLPAVDLRHRRRWSGRLRPPGHGGADLPAHLRDRGRAGRSLIRTRWPRPAGVPGSASACRSPAGRCRWPRPRHPG